MADVKWIKLNVGMFDGNSFKKIKKAKIGGESFRDKLTAVWFELMDFAGKCNAGGQLIESNEIPFSSIDDIAVMIDRETEELNLCMQFYINNRMITVIDDIYMLTNWAKYQNEDGLNKIREQTRKRVAKHRELKRLPSGNVTCNVTVTQSNATDIDIDKEEDIKDKDNIYTPVIAYLNEKAGTSYRATTGKTQAVIRARVAEGFTLDDFKKVINKKCAEWIGTEWEKFLRPETLFGTKFEGYLNAKEAVRKTYGANGIEINTNAPNDLEGIF